VCGNSQAASAPEWTATWGAAQTKAYGDDALTGQTLEGATLRQVMHISIGADRLQLVLSNAFGEGQLVLRSVKVGKAVAGKPGAVEPGSQVEVTFNERKGVSIPAGAEYLSDPIEQKAAPLSDVVVTMLIDTVPATLTFHAGSRATSFLLPGDHLADTQFASPRTFAHWYFLAGIEAERKTPSSAVVTLGDSITDGHGATTDGNDRWPDVLAMRLAAKGIGVINEGVGGNRILLDGIGPNALARFERDVLTPTGVRYLMVLEGINDLGELDRTVEHSQEVHDALLEQLKAAFLQLANRAHAHGIRVCVGTVTPFVGSEYYHPSARSEADRQKLNRWIRESQLSDMVIDFDSFLRDPTKPDRLAPEFDSGDHLHPNPAGFRRMAEAIPMGFFAQ